MLSNNNHQPIRPMKRYYTEEIRILEKRIKQRLEQLSYELADRAEQVGYTKNPLCSLSHQSSAAREVRGMDVDALNRLNEIKRLHEELFDAELKWAIENPKDSGAEAANELADRLLKDN